MCFVKSKILLESKGKDVIQSVFFSVSMYSVLIFFSFQYSCFSFSCSSISKPYIILFLFSLINLSSHSFVSSLILSSHSFTLTSQSLVTLCIFYAYSILMF